MLIIDQDVVERLELRHPGFRSQLLAIDPAVLPGCTTCGSDDTARVHFGIIQRTIDLAGATTKMKLLPNPPGPGKYFCNACGGYYDDSA